jgi:hypothetical protein
MESLAASAECEIDWPTTGQLRLMMVDHVPLVIFDEDGQVITFTNLQAAEKYLTERAAALRH